VTQPDSDFRTRVNWTSAEHAFLAIADLYADCEQTPKTLITYVLCDLRHLCDREKLSFAELDKAGHAHYLEELKSEPRSE